MLTKKTISLHLKVAILKTFWIILRRIWRYRMHMSIDVKCFTWIQLARSLRFLAHFLYVLGIFSSATHLLASSPYYEFALMTLYTFYNKKYSILLKTVFLVSQRTSWLRLIRHKFTWFYQIFIMPADEIWLTGL